MTSEAVIPDIAASVLVVTSRPLEVLMIRRPPGGMFGEAWVFPGGLVEPTDNLADNGHEDGPFRAAATRELVEETGVEIATTGLEFVSRWVTPVGMPRRYDTRFFIAVLESRPEIRLAPAEVVEAAFVAPATALAAHQAHQWRMVLPTLAHLRWLARFSSGAAALVAAKATRRETTNPRMLADGSVVEVEIPS